MQLVVGRIGRPHGIRGELTVQVRTDEPDLRFAAGSVLATEPAARGPLTVSSSRWHSGRLLVRFDGYADRTSAEDLRGTLLVMDSAEVVPSADPDEFHDHELIGLGVVTAGGGPGRRRDRRAAPGPGPAGGGQPPATRRRHRGTARSWSRSSRPSCRRSTCGPAAWSSTRPRACSTSAPCLPRRDDPPRPPRVPSARASLRPAVAARTRASEAARCGSISSPSFPSTSPRCGSR